VSSYGPGNQEEQRPTEGYALYLRRLKKSMNMEKYILPIIDNILPKLAGAKVLSLSDAASGFWQIPLCRESAKLTTFITPFGRYYFNRLPFGISSAPEIF
jgi:hypothetical protein